MVVSGSDERCAYVVLSIIQLDQLSLDLIACIVNSFGVLRSTLLCHNSVTLDTCGKLCFLVTGLLTNGDV